ncbi:hypothetical protein ACLKA7_012258 [Drosophila subpalustris]
MDTHINSLSYFRSHWTVWKILGIAYNQIYWRKLYLLYSLSLMLFVTIGYPSHLGSSVFQNDNLPDDLKNLTVFTTCLACSLKIILYAYNFDKVQQMEQLLKKLDSRVGGTEETLIYNQLKIQLRNILFIFISIYLPIAHTKMLYKRFEHIGSEGTEDSETQLEACITDHKRLLQLFRTMESFMSMPMLIQFASTALNFCIGISSFLFFSTEPMDRSYFLFYSMGVALEIFPICYYGTDTELWFGKLHYAAFSCNWTTQSRSFKKKLMLFVEGSLKQNTAMAGGMLRIHVATFFSTLKFAYSLFTILLRMQK